MNKESFIKLLKDIDVCDEAIVWCENQETLKDIFGCVRGDWWVALLVNRPEFAKHCDWNTLGVWNWFCLLEEQPQLAKYCDWSKIDDSDWDTLRGYNWLSILLAQPQCAVYCRDWYKLDDDNWKKLLDTQPQLAKYKKRTKNE